MLINLLHSRKELGELDTISFESLSKKSYDYLYKQQAICEDIYKISSYQNWYYHQTTGKLTFSDSGVVKLIIDYEEIGSISLATNTWLWAWGNAYIDEHVKQQIAKIKDYGSKRNFSKLVKAKWTAAEVDGWEMAAIAGYLLKAKGVYRVPVNDGMLLSFMLLKKITWADTTHMK